MAITGAGLSAARKAAIAVVTDAYEQSSDPEAATAYSEDILLADSTAIVDYFKANTIVTTQTGAPDGEHTGIIS